MVCFLRTQEIRASTAFFLSYPEGISGVLSGRFLFYETLSCHGMAGGRIILKRK
ncbi:MAG: hypothetical protein ACLFM7_04685 [Bacteroidales bacterium]